MNPTSDRRHRGSSGGGLRGQWRQVAISGLVAVLVTCAVLVLILPWPLPYEQPVEELMAERVAHLREQCYSVVSDGGSSEPQKLQERLYYNYFHQPRLRLLWCSISKVASSSWMYQFNRWAGVSREKIARAAQDMKGLARMHYPVPSRADVEEIGADRPLERFLVVRDPMDRFVSAYEDLIVRPKSDNYRNLRRFIFRAVHGADQQENGTSSVPSFADFTEFVLRKERIRDPHWTSYYNLCDPCFLQPTVIIKLETYDRDVGLLLRRANISSTASEASADSDRFEGHRLNVQHDLWGATGGNDGGAGAAVRSHSTRSRLAELSADQFERLYRRYELDFRLFQYDASRYFALFTEQ